LVEPSDITSEVMRRLKRSQSPVPCNVSRRHAHLTAEHVEKLFGKGYTLTVSRYLMQPEEFAAQEYIDVVGPRGTLKKVRVLGPTRKSSQIEISRTESFSLGIRTEVRNSGDIKGTLGARLIGPAGSVEITEGVIVARRHIHMTPQDAEYFDVTAGQKIRVRTKPPRAVVFEEMLVRVSDNYVLECHIDTDEANSCDLLNGAEVFLS
jgi:putative phosphotransacetylase